MLRIENQNIHLMKRTTKIYSLIALLFLVQACGSQNEKSGEKVEDTQLNELTNLEMRRASHVKDSTKIADARKTDWKELVELNPSYTDQNGTIIFNRSEVEPSFIGGNKAMMKYLRQNIVYPEQAEKDELEATVFVDFIVGMDGAIRDVEVTNATSSNADAAFKSEAVRLVSSMPKWTPGSQNDKSVNVKYSIPITFRII